VQSRTYRPRTGARSTSVHVSEGEGTPRRCEADLSGNRVLFNEGLAGEMQQQGVVGRDGHVHAAAKVFRKRVAVIVQKEGIVGKRRHGNSHLVEVVPAPTSRR
jgi:hypothetical protein